jgi:calpain
LISSFSAVAQIPEYINKVVPNDQSFGDDYCGMFHFRIWRNGYWIDVVVDDYLPVENDSLAFCKNEKDKNEMWGPLLEKAFAKVNACYEFIGNGGHPTDALVDLTGRLA